MKETLELKKLLEEDIPQVLAIEHECFATPWSENSFQQELNHNPAAFYFALKKADKLLGYGGMWVVEDEAHITNMAVSSACRKKGLGELIFTNLLSFALGKNVKWVTLEVRVGNNPAILLYQKFGFVQTGKRPDYYALGEDALILWAGNLQGEIFQERLLKLKSQWEKKHPEWEFNLKLGYN